jgi:predicted DNA binding CopG/RHH family protein
MSALDKTDPPSVDNLGAEKKLIQTAARNTVEKSSRITLRLATEELAQIKENAKSEGLPYQILINGILNKYLNGSLLDKNAVMTAAKVFQGR